MFTCSEVSHANWGMNWAGPDICSLVVLQYHSRTYWDHGRSDAHGCEHRVGHGAALIGQLDAVVIAEESSLVRWEGRLVHKHGNKHHCMVGHTHTQVNTWHHQQENKQKSTEITQTDSDIEVMHRTFSKWDSGAVPSQNKHNKICWNVRTNATLLV